MVSSPSTFTHQIPFKFIKKRIVITPGGGRVTSTVLGDLNLFAHPALVSGGLWDIFLGEMTQGYMRWHSGSLGGGQWLKDMAKVCG